VQSNLSKIKKKREEEDFTARGGLEAECGKEESGGKRKDCCGKKKTVERTTLEEKLSLPCSKRRIVSHNYNTYSKGREGLFRESPR